MGPLSFDVEMARRHKWTDDEINRAWAALSKLLKKHARPSVRRHPEDHVTLEGGDLVWIGDLDAKARRKWRLLAQRERRRAREKT